MGRQLTPEEQQRIAEEERVRMKTQMQEGAKFLKWGMKWYLILIACIIGVLLCSCIAYVAMFGGMLGMG